MANKLKPCPFKHTGNGLDLAKVHIAAPGYQYVKCPICFARGPVGESAEEAVKFWNRRPK